MVGVFFYAKIHFNLTRVDGPITILGGVHVGGPVSLVAGISLIGLGIREYFHGRSHGHGDHLGDTRSHDHHHDHSHDDGHVYHDRGSSHDGLLVA